jgi:hypothetical protein
VPAPKFLLEFNYPNGEVVFRADSMCSVFLEQLLIIHVVKKLSPFMDLNDLLLRSQ